jgi:nucleoside-diphosphate-sugar epimerase
MTASWQVCAVGQKRTDLLLCQGVPEVRVWFPVAAISLAYAHSIARGQARAKFNMSSSAASGRTGPTMGMDVSRIKEDLGFEAVIGPEVALKDYIQWRLDNNYTE